MIPARNLRYTYAQYLEALARADLKLEYLDGDIFAMAGGTATHALLGSRVIQAIGKRLPAGCEAFTSDLKLRIDATDLSTYPDASVICGPPVPSVIDWNSATNPSLLIEVTSASTEAYDRGAKLAHYQHLPSLRAVLFVSHRSPRITVVRRDGPAWSTTDHGSGDVVKLADPELALPVDEIYAGVTLETDAN